MNSMAWVSLIAVLGWLVLSVSALRAHRIGARQAVTMALAWLAAFALATAVFTVLTG
jgi:hypothetical protein